MGGLSGELKIAVPTEMGDRSEGWGAGSRSQGCGITPWVWQGWARNVKALGEQNVKALGDLNDYL